MIRLKPSGIARIDRAEVARTGTLWATFAQDDGVIRDIVRGLPGSTDLAMLASRIVSDEGTALSFNGTTNGSAGIVGTLPPIENLAFIARVRSTGAQPGNPGAAFGVYASSAQGGFGIGFNGNAVGAAWLTSAGAGTAATVPTVQGQFYTVIVQGTPISIATAAAATWVDGAPAVRGGTSSGAINGPLNEVVLGAQHASSGYLRRFRGDVLWAAILVGDSPNWMTDEIAASLYASDYPYNLVSKSRSIWAPSSGGGTSRTATSSLSAIVQQARTAGASVGAAVRAPRAATTSADAAIREARSAGAALGVAVRHARIAAAVLQAAVRRGETSSAAIDAMVQGGASAYAALGAAVAARRGDSVGLSSVVALANNAATAIDAAIAMARSAAVGVDVYVQAGFTASTSLGAAIRSARAENASLQTAVAVARASGASLDAAVVARMAALVGVDAAVRATRAGTAALTVFVDDGLPIIDSAFLRYVVPGRSLDFSVPGQSLTYSVT